VRASSLAETSSDRICPMRTSPSRLLGIAGAATLVLSAAPLGAPDTAQGEAAKKNPTRWRQRSRPA